MTPLRAQTGSTPALSWQDWLATPLACRDPSALVHMCSLLAPGAKLLHSQSLTGLQRCSRAPLHPLTGVLAGVWAVQVPPRAELPILPAGKVAMGLRAPWSHKRCLGLGMSWDCWRVEQQAGGCPPAHASTDSSAVVLL